MKYILLAVERGETRPTQQILIFRASVQYRLLLKRNLNFGCRLDPYSRLLGGTLVTPGVRRQAPARRCFGNIYAYDFGLQ